LFIEKSLRAAFKESGKKSSDVLDKYDIQKLFENGLNFRMTDDQARILVNIVFICLFLLAHF
jgi:hypothetical protein